MEIVTLFVSQRKLRNPQQVFALVEAVKNNEFIPPVRLTESENGDVQVEDGHHRITAYWLSGRNILFNNEYILVQGNQRRPRFGRVPDFVKRVMEI